MKNQPFELTADMLANARSYMPLEVKNRLAKDIAETVLADVDYKVLDITPDLMAIPPLKVERQDIKAICLLKTFLTFYLKIQFPADIDDVANYDYYAGSHVLNQLTRFKVNPELKNKAFDIEADYKDFRKFVETEIYNLKMANTDVLARLIKAIGLFSTPEMVEKLTENLQNLAKEAITPTITENTENA